jgi:hypothetical protein
MFLKRKKEGIENNNPGGRAIGKLLSNSAYGSFGMDLIIYNKIESQNLMVAAFIVDKGKSCIDG